MIVQEEKNIMKMLEDELAGQKKKKIEKIFQFSCQLPTACEHECATAMI